MLLIYALHSRTRLSADRSNSSCWSPLTTTVITAAIELPGLLGIEVRIAAAPDARIERVRQHLAGSIELVSIAMIAPAGSG